MSKRNYKKWTDEEVLFLRKNADMFTVKMLGEKLGRAKTSIQNKLTSLNIKKTFNTHNIFI
ncbi:hypothetical protein COC96_19935 [Bacillus cereus]|nr:hypothetical protein COC96_19935 [Bacillus cereus]